MILVSLPAWCHVTGIVRLCAVLDLHCPLFPCLQVAEQGREVGIEGRQNFLEEDSSETEPDDDTPDYGAPISTWTTEQMDRKLIGDLYADAAYVL
jgi:hypothetical protein